MRAFNKMSIVNLTMLETKKSHESTDVSHLNGENNQEGIYIQTCTKAVYNYLKILSQ